VVCRTITDRKAAGDGDADADEPDDTAGKTGSA